MPEATEAGHARAESGGAQLVPQMDPCDALPTRPAWTWTQLLCPEQGGQPAAQRVGNTEHLESPERMVPD